VVTVWRAFRGCTTLGCGPISTRPGYHTSIRLVYSQYQLGITIVPCSYQSEVDTGNHHQCGAGNVVEGREGAGHQQGGRRGKTRAGAAATPSASAHARHSDVSTLERPAGQSLARARQLSIEPSLARNGCLSRRILRFFAATRGIGVK
jgi:hypothetical protein